MALSHTEGGPSSVVAVGASAGGVEVLSDFARGLPAQAEHAVSVLAQRVAEGYHEIGLGEANAS